VKPYFAASLMKAEGIWNIVKSLLHDHDCVIVPRLGGFVCNREAARIDQVSHLITPPAKRIVFNQNLRTNDGLLAAKVAESGSITYSEALTLIYELVEQTRMVLQDKKQLAIETFGVFRLNADANYVFLPDRHNNYLKSSFGLIPFQAHTVASRTVKPPAARIFKDRKEIRKARKRTRNFSRGMVIALVLFALLGVNSYIFMRDHKLGDLQVSSLSLGSLFDSSSAPGAPVAEESVAEPTTPAAIEAPKTPMLDPAGLAAFAEHIKGMTRTVPEMAAGEESPAPAEHLEPIEEPQPVVDESPEVSAPVENTLLKFAAAMGAVPHAGRFTAPVATPEAPGATPITRAADTTFYIIGGVFCKQKNARRFFHDLEAKGYSPEVLENTSIHCNRVSYAKFSSRKQAYEMLGTVHASGNTAAWILALGAR
jgi:hypothetical protein